MEISIINSKQRKKEGVYKRRKEKKKTKEKFYKR